MKIALVHEFLIQQGGAEQVLEQFHDLFPEAPVYTLLYDRRKTGGRYDGWEIRPSYLQKIPGALSHYKWLLPLMPRAMESFDLAGYDLILSDSSAFAMGAVKSTNSIHICYCHTPTRYIWENHDEYISALPLPNIVKMLAHIYINKIQARWDIAASKRPDFILANSRTVQERIKKYYYRDATVIYPPVDTIFFQLRSGQFHPNDRGYFLTGSRLESYKKIDLVVEAFVKLGLPLKVVGDGSMLKEYFKKYGKSGNIEFLGRVSNDELRTLYQCARAFVFPAVEDAGIMVLESLACGTPVIGLAFGGTAEFIRKEKNGILFGKQAVDDVANAVLRFQGLAFNPEQIRQTVLSCDKNEFKRKILEFVHAHRS